MRRVVAAALTAVLMMIGATAAEPIGNPFDPKTVSIPKGYTMTSHEATRHARPHLRAIAHCYRGHIERAREVRGDMNVYLVVARTGRVVHAEVLAPGFSRDGLAGLERCVRHQTATWRFPRRAGFSNVTIPYVHLDSRHPATGTLPRTMPNV